MDGGYVVYCIVWCSLVWNILLSANFCSLVKVKSMGEVLAPSSSSLERGR